MRTKNDQRCLLLSRSLFIRVFASSQSVFLSVLPTQTCSARWRRPATRATRGSWASCSTKPSRFRGSWARWPPSEAPTSSPASAAASSTYVPHKRTLAYTRGAELAGHQRRSAQTLGENPESRQRYQRIGKISASAFKLRSVTLLVIAFSVCSLCCRSSISSASSRS